MIIFDCHFDNHMVRPRDAQFEADVLAWHYQNNSTQSHTAKVWGIHRQTVGRWLAEYENTDAYHRERFAQDASNRVRTRGTYSFELHSIDFERLSAISSQWEMDINETINEILKMALEMDGDESE